MGEEKVEPAVISSNSKLVSLCITFLLLLVVASVTRWCVKSLSAIGPVATVVESSTGLEFQARVDTGASLCSLHCGTYEINNESEQPFKNVGSTIRFQVDNRKGKSGWIETKIADYSMIKNVHAAKARYHIRLELSCRGRQREVLVTLADRSSMSHPMLLGRNFLEGQFTVDVGMRHAEQ